jgi:multiple sugar transport system permease protein
VDTEKGVARSVMTAAIFMYQTAFNDGDFGTASALAWALFALIAALTWANARLFGAREAPMREARSPSWGAWLVLGAGALLVLAPFYFTFVFGTHQRSSIFNIPPPLWFGDAAAQNLDLLLGSIPFWRNLAISLYVALATTALNLLFCSAAGYAFALLQFRGREKLFGIVLATMMVPSFRT